MYVLSKKEIHIYARVYKYIWSLSKQNLRIKFDGRETKIFFFEKIMKHERMTKLLFYDFEY